MFQEVPASKKSIGQRRGVFGVGVNDANYITTYVDSKGKTKTCPYYTKWSSMIQRCYSARIKIIRPTYKDCTVCDDWLIFSNFKKWMVNQDWIGKELDKDILVKGNKQYSPDTCLFVTNEVNSAMCFEKKSASGLPVGISIEGDKYKVRCCFNGSRKYLGLFSRLSEAVSVYNKVKFANIKIIAEKQSEPLRSAMISFILD